MTIWKKLSLAGSMVVGTVVTVAVVSKSDKIADIVRHAEASSPTKLSWQDRKRAFMETKNALGDKNIPMLAAGVAFFATLAFFPTVAAFVSIFALVATSSQVASAVQGVTVYVPHDLAVVITTQLTSSVGKASTNLLVSIIAILLSLWGASSGMQNLINALNRAYDVSESRGFIKLKLVSLGLVLGGIVIGFPLLFLLIVQSSWLIGLGAPGWLAALFMVARWLLVVVIMVLTLAALYRYGPNRRDPAWQWVSWGAVAAIVIWLAGTLLFFFYAQNFGNFSKSYGVFAGIIVLMTWFNLSSFIFLLGAQVNRRLEAQTLSSTEA